MRSKTKKQKRIYEVTVGKILFAIVIAALLLAAAFEAGVIVGKQRLIKAEMEAARQDYVQIPKKTTTGTGATGVPAANTPQQLNTPPQSKVSDVNIPTPAPTERQSTPPVPPPDQITEQKKEPPAEQRENALYTVQVGVFSSRQNADNLLNLLRSYEYEAWLKSDLSGQNPVYYLFIGRFGTKDEADKFGKSLRERLTYITDYRVKEIED